MDVKQVARIKDMITLKYGKPDRSSGKVSLGKVSYLWGLNDEISIKVLRGWPDTTTYLVYTNNKNYKEFEKREAAIEQYEKARPKKEFNSQSSNF